jgi:colanic acid/amylovoran biosynthesis glycosyltransferase
VLIEAVAMLVRTGHPLHLTVVGSGPAEAMLRSTVTELGLDDSVSLVGAKGQDELPGMYAASDIFCLASFAEGIPVVLMEAMASGVPVVSTTIAGLPELIHDGVNGLLVPPGRADLLSNALASLIDDRPTRRRLGAAGQESVRRSFDAEECGREVARQLIAPRSGPGRRPTTSQGRPEQQPQGERAIVP